MTRPTSAHSALQQRLENLPLALFYAEQGYPVFPVAVTKQPLTCRGFHDADVNHESICRIWRQHPSALVGIPTSAFTTVVADVDGELGRASLAALCRRLGISTTNLTPVRVRTPSGGLHLHFRLREGEVFRNRASDIAPHLDTRGVKEDGSPAGYIIAPGSRLPDGRSYTNVGESSDLADAAFMPKRLLYLGTFNAGERAAIRQDRGLLQKIKHAPPCDWMAVLREHRAKAAAETAARVPAASQDAARRQGLHDLHEAAKAYAFLQDGRHGQLFYVACRCAKYVTNGVVSESEFRCAFRAAATANGSLAKYGNRWAEQTLTNAIRRASTDTLPPIANRFREIAA